MLPCGVLDIMFDYRSEARGFNSDDILITSKSTSCLEELLEINRDELMHRFNSATLQFENIASDKVDKSSIIGNGRFGPIHRALQHVYSGAVHDVCAYWITNPKSLSSYDFRLLVHLLEQTAAAGSHQNLVSARGIVHQNGSTLLLLEPLSQPILQAMLRESRCARFGKGQLKSASYLSTERLLSIMIGCSVGAEELVRRSISHPHLCAANVLVWERGNVGFEQFPQGLFPKVKISGFGLAEHKALDSRKHERPLSPLRWQSPSVLLNETPSKLSSNTIWSLGVLLWEIATLGGTPYSGIRTRDEFIAKIRNRTARLSHPRYVGPPLTSLIDLCCHWNEVDRPTFEAIIRRLECLAVDANHHLNLQIDEAEETFPYASICAFLEQKAPQTINSENKL